MYKRLIAYLFAERIQRILKPESEENHWCRKVMDETTNTMIKELPYQKFSTLEISGEKWSNFGFNNYKTVQFPEFNICSAKLDHEFDLVIAEQVFEHLLWPYRAGKNVFDMVKPGGYFLITTPFLIKIHLYPHDCTRWTETGIKYFLAECGFDMDSMVTGSWGNIECAVSNFNSWTRYIPGFHSLENNGELPIVVWALAKKTESIQV